MLFRSLESDALQAGTGSINLAESIAVDANNNAINLKGADVIFNGTYDADPLVNTMASLDSGTADVTIESNNLDEIGLGDALKDLNISHDELKSITAQNLVVGGSNTADIYVDNVSGDDLVNVANQLELKALGSGGDVRFVNQDSSFKDLSASAKEKILVETNLSTTLRALSLASNADSSNQAVDEVNIAADKTLTAATDLILSGYRITAQGGLSLDAKIGRAHV